MLLYLQDRLAGGPLVRPRLRISPESAAVARSRLHAVVGGGVALTAPAASAGRPPGTAGQDAVARYGPPTGVSAPGGVTSAAPAEPSEDSAEATGSSEDSATDRAAPPPGTDSRPRARSAVLAHRVASRLEPHLPPSVRGGLLAPGARAVGALAAVGLVAAVLAGAYLWRSRPDPVTVPDRPLAVSSPTPAEASHTTSSAPALVVDVAGKIADPGVYRLPEGARVVDAIEAAGGVEGDASTASVNLARPLVDGEKIFVGTPQPAQLAAQRPSQPDVQPKLDLNAATAQQLEDLPGIGEVLAERIVEYRADNGRFDSVADLDEVSGIGSKTRAELEDEVRV